MRRKSYVREEPVSEDVDLVREWVEVVRRPVDRPVAAGEDAFRERTIEAEERREEAVVTKEARVVEEIGLRRTQETERETVSDTVRRTEVVVEEDEDDKLDRR
jgi:stress response protein YsnF